jgi:chromosome partitioning protein
VGKTTTSMNLAAAVAVAGTRVLLLDVDPLSTNSGSLNLAEQPRRQALRQSGFDLPGVLVSDFVPGLDIFSPYEDCRCSDGDLDELLRLITSPPCAEGYGCIIVDTPPFLGANPAQLLAIGDELIVVMQAEALAYRTLPAFLELVQRARGDNEKIHMRGILLTLPEGEVPGGRWERELRGRFGSRILPRVIPYDDAVNKALEVHQIVTAAAPETPVAVAYRDLAASLDLAAKRRPHGELTPSPLLAAAALFTPAGVGAKGGSLGLDLPETPVGGASSDWRAEPPEEPEPAASSAHLDWLAGREDDDLPLAVPALSLPRSGRFARPVHSPRKTPLPALSPSVRPKAETKEQATTKPVPRPSRAPQSFPTAFVWVGLAAVVGVGLRFVQLPDFMMPVVVGVAVTAGVVLTLHLLSADTDNKSKAAPAR